MVSMGALRESRVCVRYRHCERDAVDVGDGAAGVSRHPGLLHLLVCLRHGGKRAWPRVGRCGLEMRSGGDALEVLAFWGGTCALQRHSMCPSSFHFHYTRYLFFHHEDEHATAKYMVSEHMEVSRVHVLEPIMPCSVPVNVALSIELNSAQLRCMTQLYKPRMRSMGPDTARASVLSC
jgi:hypothetical protein